MARQATAPMVRVLARCIAGPNGCVLWTGAKTPAGYGQIHIGKRRISVHRIAYEAAKGPIPVGLEIDHLCNVRSCVNAHHLEAVTHRENLLRSSNPVGQNARKTHCVHGHELTPENLLNKKYGRVCRTCSRRHNRDSKLRTKLAASDG